MKQIVKAYEIELYDNGPYTLEKFTTLCNEKFAAAKKNWQIATSIIESFTIEAKLESDYGSDYSYINLVLHIYRTETDEEELLRLQETEKRKKYAAEAKKKVLIKKKVKDALEKDPEYKKFQELKKKYEKI